MDIGEMQKRLSLKHHTIKTENDRQRESRVP